MARSNSRSVCKSSLSRASPSLLTPVKSIRASSRWAVYRQDPSDAFIASSGSCLALECLTHRLSHEVHRTSLESLAPSSTGTVPKGRSKVARSASNDLPMGPAPASAGSHPAGIGRRPLEMNLKASFVLWIATIVPIIVHRSPSTLFAPMPR